MDEAVRRGLPGWYEQAVADAGIAAVGDPQLDLSDLPERACRCPSRSRWAWSRRPSWATTRGSRSGAARPPSARRGAGRAGAPARVARLARDGRARGRPGRLRGDRLRRLRRRRAVRGRRGARPPGGARVGPADPRVRGAARRHRRRRRARGERHLPRRLSGRAPRRQGRLVRRRGQGGQGEAAARAGRRLRRRGRRLRLARRAA